MNVGDEGRLRLRGKLREIPEQRRLDGAVDIEAPALAGDVGRDAQIQHRPVLGQVLAGWKALFSWARNLAGEKPALARPALFGLSQLGFGQLGIRRGVVLGHG